MIDEKFAEEQVEEIKKALIRNAEEREMLESLFKGFNAWLRLHRSAGGVKLPQLALPIEAPKPVKPPISFRQSIFRVLQEANGKPLHVSEIWRRAQKLGAQTKSKNPEGLVDLSAYTLLDKGAHKVAPRTWTLFLGAEASLSEDKRNGQQ